MRVITELSVEGMKVTLFSWNEKYLVKFEAGPYEQTFKVKEVDISGEDEIKALLKNEAFVKSVQSRFREMHKDFMVGLG